MIVNLSNPHFDSVSIFTHFTQHGICMYLCLVIANILKNYMHAYKHSHNSDRSFFTNLSSVLQSTSLLPSTLNLGNFQYKKIGFDE